MKITSKGKMLSAILGVAFIVYIAVLLTISGFSGHNATFWISAAFMVIAFAAMAGAGIILGMRGMLMRDWLFGLPIIKHSAIYIICEFFASVIFMIFYKKIPWPWAFAVQLVILGIYLVFAISCFLTKEIIDDVQRKVKDGTSFIRLLQTDAEMAAEQAKDDKVKAAFKDLAKNVRFSDPMSVPALFELEKEIAYSVNEARKRIDENDNETALELCKKASLLLSERNKKTKVLK